MEKVFDYSDRTIVADSLVRFVTQVNGEEADGEARIVVTTLTGKYGGASGSDDELWFPLCHAASGDYYLDEANALGLAIPTPLKEHPVLIAVSTFAFGHNWVPDYEPKNCDRLLIPTDSPVILQLQGPSSVRCEKYLKDHNSDWLEKRLAECQLAKTLMRNVRWEVYLLKMWIRWARSEEIPNLFVLPGEMNRYYREDLKESFHMRYDVTARRCGFRMGNNGLYGLSLS